MNKRLPQKPKILVVDDEVAAADNLAYVCRKEGYDVETKTSGHEAISILNQQTFDVVLTDLKMENIDGMAVLNTSKKIHPDSEVIMVTGHATLDSAVEAMKAGAFHYIAKPYRLDEVRELVRKALEIVQLKKENQSLKQQLADNHNATDIVTNNSVMQRILEMAKQISPTDTNVLISGESGTGKELLAKYIHQKSSRNSKIFQAINCGAFQEELLANELFGHEKGAFTGATEAKAGLIEAAEGGTVFLDEIAEMSLAMQVKLLRMIQEREIQRLGSTKTIPVNVRLIAATHQDLKEQVAKGSFRHDLFYRLDVVGLHLPPLAERKEDIPSLITHFLRKHSLKMNKNVYQIDNEALQLLHNYDFPGNIRELENIIERGVALCKKQILCSDDLPRAINSRMIHVIRETKDKLPTLAEREIEYIHYVLNQCDQNRTKAAKVLGIDRVSLWRKLKAHNMET